MIKFRTGYSHSIEAVEVERETEAFVFLPETKGFRACRQAKTADWHRYHDSWDDAKSYLVWREREKLESAKSRVVEIERDLQKALDIAEK